MVFVKDLAVSFKDLSGCVKSVAVFVKDPSWNVLPYNEPRCFAVAVIFVSLLKEKFAIDSMDYWLKDCLSLLL
jgi:hypothetical protein